jgi:hypothetical protein
LPPAASRGLRAQRPGYYGLGDVHPWQRPQISPPLLTVGRRARGVQQLQRNDLAGGYCVPARQGAQRIVGDLAVPFLLKRRLVDQIRRHRQPSSITAE